MGCGPSSEVDKGVVVLPPGIPQTKEYRLSPAADDDSNPYEDLYNQLNSNNPFRGESFSIIRLWTSASLFLYITID